MPISADRVRELAARGEQSRLDFKTADYDWAGKKSANAELAKDLSAIANILGPNAQPGYILIGVENDGTIVGMTTPHVDDAALHQKVRDLLNRSPDFTYGPVEVDGKSVGVYEIRAGGGPYFPVKDASPSLHAMIPPGAGDGFRLLLRRNDAFEHFRAAKLDVPGFNGNWVAFHVSVECRTDLGGVETLSCRAPELR